MAERTAAPLLLVAACALVDADHRVLLTRRPIGKTMAGLWEFPGGKCESGETHDACLVREMAEELGVIAHVGPVVLSTEHTYPERTVRLHFHRCEIDGEPQPLLGQEIRWVRREELHTLEFPEADRELLDVLKRMA